MENYIELFISEFEQYIKQLNHHLLVLERNPRASESVSEVFRIFHTIKGMAQTMGYDTLSNLSHRTEDLLSGSKKTGEVKAYVTDLLFVIVDVLAQFAEALRTKHVLPQVDDLLEAIEKVQRGESFHLCKGGVRTERVPEVRIKMQKLDTLFNLTNELTISRSRLAALSQDIDDERLSNLGEAIARMISSLQDEVMKLRMLPLSGVFEFFPRWFRDETKRMNKDVEFVIVGANIEVDRSIIDQLKEPLMHLIRNALDHGIAETKGKARDRIEMYAVRERDRILISVADNGKGIDIEEVKQKAVKQGIVSKEEVEHYSDYDVYRLLTHPEFSTRDAVSTMSGRGMGLDIVVKTAERLGGRLLITSKLGVGTCFTLDLPLSMAIVRAMVVHINGQRFALPLTYVKETMYVDSTIIKRVYHRELLPLRDEILPLVRLSERLGCGNLPGRKSLVVIEHAGKRRGFIADSIVDEEEIVVKQLDSLLESSLYSGCSIYADGQPILILDPRGFV
ncbi:chemotaxis protein CheA [candidate division WOR-3 bacterium]|nr:chemotaxis protein CheA [candidate division WOR-3 bacterium]